jgi:hypothetical protein
MSMAHGRAPMCLACPAGSQHVVAWYALKNLTSVLEDRHQQHAARVRLGRRGASRRARHISRTTRLLTPMRGCAAGLTIWSATDGAICSWLAAKAGVTQRQRTMPRVTQRLRHAGGRMNMQVRPHVGYGCVDCVPLLQPQRCGSTHFFPTPSPVRGTTTCVHAGTLAPVVLLGMHHYSHWGARRCVRGTPTSRLAKTARALGSAARRGTLCPRSLAKLDRIARTRPQLARFVLRCPVHVRPTW